MTRLMRIAALAAVVMAAAVGVPAAGADTTWTKVSTDFNANIAIPSLGLTGTTAVVAWTQADEPVHDRSQRRQLHDLADAGRDRGRTVQGARRAGRRSTTPTRSSRLPAEACS